jgi:hypothetical protein
MRPLAQISDAPLLSYEQVSLGNYTVGRGFEPGIALGDSALGAAFELRYGSLFPAERERLRVRAVRVPRRRAHLDRRRGQRARRSGAC